MGNILRAFLGILVLLLVWLFAVLAMGMPPSWIREIEGRLPETPFVAEADTVSFDFIRGILLRNARIYHKGEVGLPLVSASRVRLAVNPLALLAGGAWLREVWIEDGVMRTRPASGAAGPARPPPDFGRYAFHLNLGNSRLFGLGIASGQADVSLSGSQLRLTRTECEIGEKEGPRARIQGSLNLDFASRRYQADLNWAGDPLALEPFLQEIDSTGPLPYFRLFKAGDRPASGDAEIEGGFGRDWSFALAVSGAARECAFRGVPLRQVFLSMRFKAAEGKPAELAFDPVVLIREDGLAAGGFSVDFTTGDITFDGYSTCPPQTLVRLGAPKAAERLETVRVDGAVRIHAGGKANSRDLTRNAATVFLEGQKVGLDRLMLDRLAFTARLTGTSIEIHDVAGELYGGSFTGAVDLVAAWTSDQQLDQVQFSVQGGVRQVDARRLAAAAGLREEAHEGLISGYGRISGVLDTNTLMTMTGRGNLQVERGRLFRFPLFGPLSAFLSRVIPGLEPEADLTQAACDWRLEEGELRSDNIVVGGDRVSLNARGQYGLTNSLNFDLQLKLMNTETLLGRAVRVITLPVSKLFEFKVKGTMRDPVWYPTNFSSDLFDRLARRKRGEGDEKDEPEP